MAHRSFKLNCGLQKFFGVVVVFHHFFQFRHRFNRFFQRDVERDELGNLVAEAIGETECPAGVTYGGPGHHRSESDDLSDFVGAVFFPDVSQNFIPPGVGKVDVDIGNLNPVRI